MIRFGIRSHFLPNDASISEFWFDQEVFLNHDNMSFLLSNKSKLDWKVKMLHNRMPRLDIQVQFFRKFLKTLLLLIPKNICFLQTEFISAAFVFRSVRRSLWRPKLPRLSIMFHTCSLSKLFPETDSCTSLSSLSSDWFCLKTSFQGFVSFFPWKPN